MDLIVPTEGIDGVSGRRIYEPLQLEVSHVVSIMDINVKKQPYNFHVQKGIACINADPPRLTPIAASSTTRILAEYIQISL